MSSPEITHLLQIISQPQHQVLPHLVYQLIPQFPQHLQQQEFPLHPPLPLEQVHHPPPKQCINNYIWFGGFNSQSIKVKKM